MVYNNTLECYEISTNNTDNNYKLLRLVQVLVGIPYAEPLLIHIHPELYQPYWVYMGSQSAALFLNSSFRLIVASSNDSDNFCTLTTFFDFITWLTTTRTVSHSRCLDYNWMCCRSGAVRNSG